MKDIQTAELFDMPVWEVHTPCSQHRLIVRSMTVAQEERLKTSSASTMGMLSILNQIIFECINDKPDDINTITKFEERLSIEDRYAIVYGIMVATYGESQELDFVCRYCENRYTNKSSITENVKLRVAQDDSDVMNKEVEFVLPVSKYKIIMKQPNLKDEKMITKSISTTSAEIGSAEEYSFIKELRIPIKKDEKNKEDRYMIVDNLLEIYARFRNMPAGDRKAAVKAWKDEFNYGISVYANTKCPKCGKPAEIEVDILRELFRVL